MELLQAGVANTNLPIVLIVEDDLAIQAIVDEALIEAGFETALAPSAEEALTLLKGKVANYKVLVTDIDLKGMINGWQVAKAAREIDPAFPIASLMLDDRGLEAGTSLWSIFELNVDLFRGQHRGDSSARLLIAGSDDSRLL
jgi:CheY-like chemotaxis protein